jgi:hypothetical protein
MIKKSLATALLVCAIPAMANASWFLTTQAKNAGGSLTTSNGTQIVTDGVITKSYKTIADQTPSATPVAGNSLRALIITDSSYNPPVPVGSTFTPVDGHSYTVAATFQVSKLAVGASIAGGTVTPVGLGNIYYGYKLTSPVTFTFAPAAGSYINAINGAPAEATVSALPGGVNQRATVTLPAGYTFTGAISLQATTVNTTPTINHILPQTIVAGKNVTVAATGANLLGTYNWTYVSGPANTATYVGAKIVNVAGPAIAAFPAAGASVTFAAPTTPGQYKFLVSNGGVASMAVVNVVATAGDAVNQCQFCHTANGIAGSTPTQNIGISWAASVHSGSTSSICSGCHYGTGNGGHPGTVTAASVNNSTFVAKVDGIVGGNGTTVNTGTVFCTSCHAGGYAPPHVINADGSTTLGVTCAQCHTATSSAALGTGDAHSVQANVTVVDGATGCVNCHSLAQKAVAGMVNDNSGVRAIIPEFQKTSHHIYNGSSALPIDAQCAICHLEGKASNGKVVVDASKHMSDAKIHLRKVTDNSEFAWDPSAANPDFTGMDNFCFSCHTAGGASDTTAIPAIQAVINAANPTGTGAQANAGNPFGDLLTNKYDQITRAQVVDVKSAMDPANASHHAVSAPKYKTRSTATAISNGDMVAGQSTLSDGGLFTNYTPLGATATVGDDSQLHCGDCHTVGQWRASDVGSSQYNQAAIGAHGSNNEYMLRNNLGTDALHNGTTYVCFNCHNDNAGITAVGAIVGGIANTAATAGGYYAGYNAAGASPKAAHLASLHTGTNADFQSTAGNTGNAISATGRLGGNMFQLNNTGAAVSKGAVAGNITGIACINCHNSGLRSALGGIHGGNTTYSSVSVGTAPANAQQKPYRFMGGMGNFRYTPPSNDLSNVANPNKPQSSQTGTCYTNTNTTDNAGYSSCNHHATGTTNLRQGGSVGNVARPLSY